MNLAKWLLAAFHNILPAGHTSTRQPYSGDELRAIRKRNGVGRPPAIGHTALCRNINWTKQQKEFASWRCVGWFA
jgi:hypothetical protein